MSVILVAACCGYPALIGAVILVDRVMAGSVYRKPIEPLIVSSLLGPLWVIPFFWTVAAVPVPMEAALLAFVAGVLLTVTNWSYFEAMFWNDGKLLYIVGGVEAARPVAVALVMQLLPLVGLVLIDNLGLLQWSGVLVTVFGLVLVKCWGEKHHPGALAVEDGSRTRAFILLSLLIFFVLGGTYTLVYKEASERVKLECVASAFEGHVNLAVWRSLLPYFWFGAGFSGVVIPLGFRRIRKEFRECLPRVAAAWKLILLTELLAAAGFCCELFALEGLHPAYVAMASSGTGLVVLFGGFGLRHVFGFREEIPALAHPGKKAIGLAFVMLGVWIVVF